MLSNIPGKFSTAAPQQSSQQTADLGLRRGRGWLSVDAGTFERPLAPALPACIVAVRSLTQLMTAPTRHQK